MAKVTLGLGAAQSIDAGEDGLLFTNFGPATVSYSDSQTVADAPEGTISADASASLYGTVWLYAATRAEVQTALLTAAVGAYSRETIPLTDADFNNFVSENAEEVAGWRIQPGGSSDTGATCELTRIGDLVTWRGRIEWVGPAVADDLTGFSPRSVLSTGVIPAAWLPDDDVLSVANTWDDQVTVGDYGSHFWQFFVHPYDGGRIDVGSLQVTDDFASGSNPANLAPWMGQMTLEGGDGEYAAIFVNISWPVKA